MHCLLLHNILFGIYCSELFFFHNNPNIAMETYQVLVKHHLNIATNLRGLLKQINNLVCKCDRKYILDTHWWYEDNFSLPLANLSHLISKKDCFNFIPHCYILTDLCMTVSLIAFRIGTLGPTTEVSILPDIDYWGLGTTWDTSLSSHCCGYYPGTLPCSEVSETHAKIGHP